MNQSPESERRKAIPWWWYLAAGVPLALLAVVLLTRGSTWSSGSPNAGDPMLEEIEAAQRDELFDYAIESINRQEEFSTSEMLKQAVDRLDNWIQDHEPPADWQPDPMLATLPDPMRQSPGLSKLDELAFTLAPPSADGWTLQQAVWLRDLSNWARGDEVGDVERATRLFDWTVRNIQLDPIPEKEGSRVRAMQKPWETLMLGQGKPEERAWVFILLARNQGLDAAMIGPAGADDGQAQEDSARLVGVLSGDQLYLFDPELGLPVPAADGVKLDETGRLAVEPASLEQVVADGALLRRLDAGDERPYPLRAAQLDGAVAWLESTPAALSLRMKLVESRLSGKDKLVLTTDPTAQAERLKRCKQIGQVRLWTRPYQTALQEARNPAEREAWRFNKFLPFQVGVGQPNALWKGRSYHLKGRLEGTPSAVTYYQAARPSNREIAELEADDQMKRVLLHRKLSASYWLGLVAAYQGNYRAAIDYLETRMLHVTANNPWLHGGVYNMARILEGGQAGLAIGLYRADDASPAHHGNLLRAQWLQELTGAVPATPGAAQPADAAKKRPDAPAKQPPGDQPEAKPTPEPNSQAKPRGEEKDATQPEADKADSPTPQPAPGSPTAEPGDSP